MDNQTKEESIRWKTGHKQVNTEDKRITVTIEYEGELKHVRDALTILTDWICTEIRDSGHDPVRIVHEINKIALQRKRGN